MLNGSVGAEWFSRTQYALCRCLVERPSPNMRGPWLLGPGSLDGADAAPTTQTPRPSIVQGDILRKNRKHRVALLVFFASRRCSSLRSGGSGGAVPRHRMFPMSSLKVLNSGTPEFRRPGRVAGLFASRRCSSLRSGGSGGRC